MVHLQVDLPPILKKALLDDYACIVEEGRLQPLPRQPTIDQLLQRYTGDVRNGGGGQRRRVFVWEMRGKGVSSCREGWPTVEGFCHVKSACMRYV